MGVGGLKNVIEPLGNVLKAVPGETTAPVWSFDDPQPGQPKAKTMVFTCPVSAVPKDVWDLLQLWQESRLMGLPVVAGGLEDQPAGVRASFPFFYAEHAIYRQRTGASGSEQTAVMVATAMLQGMFGKGK